MTFSKNSVHFLPCHKKDIIYEFILKELKITRTPIKEQPRKKQ